MPRAVAAVAVVLGIVALARGAALRTSARELGGGFLDKFDGPTGLDHERFSTSGYWNNGQPFNSGWDPAYWTVKDQTLILSLKKDRFQHQDWDFPYTSGEIRSRVDYGEGCYS